MSALVGIVRSPGQAQERAETTLLRGVRALRGVRYGTELAVGNVNLAVLEDDHGICPARVKKHDRRSSANGRVDVSLGNEERGEALRAILFSTGEEVALERQLLARRPFYFARRQDGALVFSDRVDAVLAMLDRSPGLSPAGLAFFLTQYGVPAPWTVVEGIWKIGPGRRLALRAGGDFRISDNVTGAALPHVRAGKLTPDEVRDLVRKALSERADLADGAGILLSGGLDSTIVLAQLKDLDLPPERSYILRYTDPLFDRYDWDARYAWLVAWKFGLDIENVAIDPGVRVRVLLNRLLGQANEPVADPAMIPLYLAAKAAAQQEIRVLWDGRGADELFAAPHTNANLDPWYWWFLAPAPVRQVAGRLFTTVFGKPGSRKKAKWLAEDLPTSVFWQESVFGPQELEKLGPLPLEPVLEYFEGLRRRGRENHPGGLAQRTEWETWLAEQNQPLAETVARMTGVQFHSPFLDEHIVLRAMGVPFRERVPRGPNKRILRDAFRNDVPREVLRRRKRGLGTPVGWWVQEMQEQVRYDVKLLRATFGDDLLRWNEVERFLTDVRTEPVIRWQLLSLVSWLRLHLVESRSASPRAILRSETVLSPARKESL
ncbi:MAG TPA: asparagine synthase [Bacteroidetes bacterium]|nr:asparagine synthase [Bacteroidota bacterium]